VTYEGDMIEKYGEDIAKHPRDDPELWAYKQGGSGKRTFGIGSSDLEFVMTGIPSSGSFSSYAKYKQSQEEVCLFLYIIS